MKKTKQSVRGKSPKQKVYYDKKTDVLWLMVKKGAEEEHKEISPGVSIELGKGGELLGIEVLNASKVLGPKMGFTQIPSMATLHKIR